MNTNSNEGLTVVVQRDLKPQWLKGGLNLGAFSPNTLAFNGKGLLAFMGKSDTHADAVADMVAGASHIRFGSKMGQAIAAVGLPEKGVKANADGTPMLDAKGDKVTFEEKHEAWMERVYEIAKANAKERIPGATLDYTTALEEWVTEDFAKRGCKADSREVLEDYYKIVAMVERGWEDVNVPEAKKANLLNKLKLSQELLAGTAEEVKAAIAAKYKPEAVKLDEKDHF